MITIYDKDGNAKTVDSVDAREHIETGEWFAVKPESVPEPVPEPPAADRKPGRGDHR